MKSLSFIAFVTLSTLIALNLGCSSIPSKTEGPQLNPILVNVAPEVRVGTKTVNGVDLYYEIHGTAGGIPLVLLHGGGSSIDVTYSKMIPLFAKHRTVIAIDEQAHGRSGDRSGPVRFETSADDVAALLKAIKIEKADLMGFSNGANVALQVAIRHPAVVHKLVFISSFTKRSGAPKYFWDFIRKANFDSMPQPLKEAYLKISNNPAGLRNMHDKDSERMKNFKDVPDQDIRSLKTPTLIVLGDHDVVTPDHAVWLTKQIKGSRLLILPGEHGDFLGEITQSHGESRMPELTAGLIETFLGQPDVPKK